MSPHAVVLLRASGQRNGLEQMFPTTLMQESSSIPSLLPARPSCGYHDNLPGQYHFATCWFFTVGNCPPPPPQILKLVDRPLSAFRNRLFDIFAATLLIWRPSSPSAT
jgi:hypothetical protein